MHRKSTPVVVFAIGAILLLAGGSLASLNGDPNAYDDGSTNWTGVVQFKAVAFNMFLEWAADIEYCVYAPGNFGLSFPGQDPSAGQEFVYAYQIFNNLDPYPTSPPLWNGDKGHINAFSVGINDGDEQAGNDGFVADVNVDPSSHSLSGSSVFFGFAGASQLDYGEISDVLIFTSPFVPEWDNATASGVFPDTKSLPSPAPEPATMGLLIMGLAMLWTSKRH